MFGTISNHVFERGWQAQSLWQWVILLVSLVGATTDLIWGKIYNKLTLSVALAGIIYWSYQSGFPGFLQAILGFLAGLVLYGWMFGLKILGGGDVKLLMCLGAWGGPRYTFEVAVLGILVSGVVSLGVLIVTGKLIDFVQRMVLFVITFQVRVPKVDKKMTIPMGVPIAIAAIWIAFFNSPLRGGGLGGFR